METKRGTTREVNGDLVLGGNSEYTIKNLRDPQAADEPVTLGYYESHGGGGGDASTWSQHPATQDVDMDGHDVVGLPAYSGSSPPADQSAAASFATVANAMTEAIAGWATAPASQDVDMDGNKITGLDEPMDASDAATKAYVDAHAGPSDRIKGGAGTTYEETEIGVGPDATGDYSILLSGKNRGDEFLSLYARESNEGIGWIGWHNIRSGYGRGYVRWSSDSAELCGAEEFNTFGRVYVDGANGGNVYFDMPGADGGGGYELLKGIRLGSRSGDTPNVRALPSNVNSILHGIKLGVDAHNALASMPVPPELEWWDPVWTLYDNVNSVSNVECQYTRTYRAAGGSLVTLEGTIAVEIDDDGASTSLAAPLPVPATGTGMLLAPAVCLDFSSGIQLICTSGILHDPGSGPMLIIETTPHEDALGNPDTLTIGFRISYRAA